MDAHGKTPLDFVGSDAHRQMWIEFLEERKDEYFPVVMNSNDNNNGTANSGNGYSPEARDKDTGLGIPDLKDALSVELAEKVASGHIMPEEAKRQQHQQAQ